MKRLAAIVALALIVLPVIPALADPGGNPSDQTQSEARTFYDQGLAHARRKQWHLAIEAYLQAIRVEPRFVEAWNNLGYAYRKINDNQRALDAYRRALEIRPDFASAHEYIGRLYIALGNKDMAMRHYEILRRLDARLAAELLRAIEANTPDYGENDR